MSDKTEVMATLQIRLPQKLLQRIDSYRLSLTIQPSRSQMIRYLCENGMVAIEDSINEQSKNLS